MYQINPLPNLRNKSRFKKSPLLILPIDKGDNIDVMSEMDVIPEPITEKDPNPPELAVPDHKPQSEPMQKSEYEAELLKITLESLEVIKEVKKVQERIVSMREKQRVKMTDIVEKAIEIAKGQCEMILEILEVKEESPEKTEMIMKKYEKLEEYRIPFTNRQEMSYKMLIQCLKVSCKEILKEIKKVLEKSLKRPSNNHLGELKVSISKLVVLSELLPYAAIVPKSDIFNYEKGDPYVKELKENVKIKSIASTRKIQKSYRRFLKSMSVAISMLTREKDHPVPVPVVSQLTTTFGLVYDSVLNVNMDRKTNLFYSQPNQDIIFQVWNMLDQKPISQLLRVVYPHIKHSKKIYIYRRYDSLCFGSVKEAYENETINKVSPPFSMLEIPEEDKKELPPPTYKELRKKGDNKIPLRILSAESIPATKEGLIEGIFGHNEKEDRQEQGEMTKTNLNTAHKSKRNICMGWFKGCFGHVKGEEVKIKPTDDYFDGVILHIHGGGFVAMSSSSHQTYTRQWAKRAGKPILSIDYRLAPKDPYPAAIDDCWQAYNWALNDMEKALGIKAKKIVIAGDSAGGNLALAVTFLAIKNGIRVPDGLLLSYPAMRVDVKAFTPSFLIALNDKILPHSVLKMIPTAYLPENADPKGDPLISPLYASDELLEKLPPIRMMVGEKDPLHDDCWRLVDRLTKLKKDVKMTVYRDLAHGFLGYDLPGVLPMTRTCILEAGDMLKELFNKE